tara:strand:+ start:172 stop:363 length:192 start_codon:yes stop_codon:yes gene_type:complete
MTILFNCEETANTLQLSPDYNRLQIFIRAESPDGESSYACIDVDDVDELIGALEMIKNKINLK